MSDRIKLLGTGTLGVSNTSMYKTPSNYATKITGITIVNNHSASVQVTIIRRSGNVEKSFYPVNLEYGASYFSKDDTLYYMGLNDELIGRASVAGVIDFQIDGVETQQAISNTIR